MINEAVARMNAQLAESVRQWQRQLDAVIPTWMATISESIRETERRFDQLVPNAFELGSRGWTIPMLFPVPGIDKLLQTSHTSEEYDDGFLRYYQAKRGARMQEMFASLREDTATATWHPLLEQCFKCYIRKQYLVVVPSLFLVLEGIIAEAGAALKKKADPKAIAATRRRRDTPGFRRLVWASLEGFTSVTFKSSDFAGDRPDRTNRHWVLHGRDAPAWHQVDAIRLFQAIHTATSCVPHRRSA